MSKNIKRKVLETRRVDINTLLIKAAQTRCNHQAGAEAEQSLTEFESTGQ